LLSAIIFLPLAGAAIIALLAKSARTVRLIAVVVTVADLVLVISVFVIFNLYDWSKEGNLELVERYREWIPSLKIQYFLGVDGLNLPMVLLTSILGMCAVFSSWNIKTRVKEYFIWLMVLQTAVAGVFLSQDFVLFFMFWELELIPMYLLISIWGSGRKEYSAMKFITFTLLGSAFMLIAILIVYLSSGTFDMVELASMNLNNLLIPTQLVFFMFFAAFAIKLPAWPVHTWLPDAHTDAPTAVSVMLAGVLLKMGGYGLIRVCIGMFPEIAHDYAFAIAILAVISVLYGSVVTLRQSDLKRLIAYSSVSHMGLVLLGISAAGGVSKDLWVVGLNGAAIQMFTHGTITGLLFILVGLIYDKAHTRHIPDLGGLAGRMPIIASALVIGGLASLGLPATSGFVAEITLFLGTFLVWSWPTILAAFGIVLTAGYILWMLQRVLFGPQLKRFENVGDATVLEAIPIGILVVAIMAVGIYPSILTDVFSSGIDSIIGTLR
jgi:NADH-quinone oxidoreductase subunit M